MRAAALVKWVATESGPAIAMRHLLSYSPTIEGRGTRTEMFATLGTVVVISVFVIVSQAWLQPAEGTGFGALLTLFHVLLAAMPIGSALIRRLHDVNRHAWGLLVIAAPYVGWAILAFQLLSAGDDEENIFGPSPRGLS